MELEEKETKKRNELREWEKLHRETKTEEMKSEMAAEQLSRMQEQEDDSAF